MRCDAARSLHLLLEKPEEAGRAGSAVGRPLVVPPGVSFLMSSGREPQLLAEAPAPPAAAWVVEPVPQGAQLALLVLSPAGRPLSVNGQTAPRLALLREKDEIRLPGDDHVLHVTVFNRPRVGPPADEMLGQLCPVCRSPFVAGTTVYVCACGAGLHMEGEDRPAAERLECLRLSGACPCCNRPVVLTEGYSYVPEIG